MTRMLVLSVAVMAAVPAVAEEDGGARSFHVTVAPGESLWVEERGRGAPVVLVPGLLGGAFGYRHVSARLAQLGFRAVAVEPLGIGRSSRPGRADWSLTAQADRLAAVLRGLDVTDAVLVVHAVGAGAGFRLAVRHPDLVRAVVSIDGGVVETALTPGLRSALRFAPFVRFFGAGGRIRRRIASGVAEASGDTAWLTPDVIEAYTKGSSGAQERVLRAMGSAREPEPLEPNLARIRCPVLLLTGTAGSVAAPSVEEVARMRARLPSLAVERVAGAGHYIQEERPEVVVQAIERMDRGTRAALAGEAGPPAAAVRPGPWKEE